MWARSRCAALTLGALVAWAPRGAHAQASPAAPGTPGAAAAVAATPSAAPANPAPPAPTPGSRAEGRGELPPLGPRPDARGDAARAVVHYERSRVQYAAGRYRMSIVELETAIRLDPSGTNLYFDLGLLFERVGRIDRAIEAYRSYLVRTSDAAERERAERILRRLNGARDELRDLYQTRTGRADALFWGLAAGGIAAAVIGGSVLFSAVRASDEVGRLRAAGASPRAVADAEGSALAQHVTADTFLLTGVGLGVAAVALYFTREAPPRAAPLCVGVTASAQGVGLAGAF